MVVQIYILELNERTSVWRLAINLARKTQFDAVNEVTSIA